jgi:hypothetical protein
MRFPNIRNYSRTKIIWHKVIEIRNFFSRSAFLPRLIAFWGLMIGLENCSPLKVVSRKSVTNAISLNQTDEEIERQHRRERTKPNVSITSSQSYQEGK